MTFLLGLGVIGCASVQREEVTYTLYRKPVELFKKMKVLGISANKQTHKVVLDHLNNRIGKCSQYSKKIGRAHV